MNEKFQILLRLRAIENTFCMKNVEICTVNLNLECVVSEGFCEPRMCGVGRFLFHKGIKFLGRVSSFFITLSVQHPGGVGTLSSQRDFRGHIPALTASAED
jgi:hypothetical protein